MALSLQFLLLLTMFSTLLALPVGLRQRRGDSESSSGTKVSRQTVDSSKSEESMKFFEGDIALKPGTEDPIEQVGAVRAKRESVIHDKSHATGDSDFISQDGYKTREDLWPDGKVPYKFEEGLSTLYRDIYLDAMNWWDVATDGCITFHAASKNETDYLLLTKDEGGCSSYVGRQGGEQRVNISSKCNDVGNAAHELGHALGLWHEHSRRDRDDYVEIMQENIDDNGDENVYERNFGKLKPEVFNKVPPVSYDIESIMHYGPKAFGKPNQDLQTIRPRPNAPWDMCDDITQMGQRTKISYKDTLRVKVLYGCSNVTATDMPQGCDKTKGTPTPTPTPTTPTPVLATPTPTRKLISGDVITLHYTDDESKQVGVECDNVCKKIECVQFIGVKARCTNIENQFKIIKEGGDCGKTKIKSGDHVLLESFHRPGTWLNCSGPNRECVVSSCTSNAADLSNSSTHVSDCDEHRFIVSGRNREKGQVLSTRHRLQFKSINNENYLNCFDKKCRMLEMDSCAISSVHRTLHPKNEDQCHPHEFMVQKHNNNHTCP